MNATLHVANMVGNIGRLEGSGNAYRFYADGYTTSLVTLLEALDAERLAIADAFGVQVPGIHQWLLQTYGLGGASLPRNLPPPDPRADRPLPVDADADVAPAQVRHGGRAVRPRRHVGAWVGPPPWPLR